MLVRLRTMCRCPKLMPSHNFDVDGTLSGRAVESPRLVGCTVLVVEDKPLVSLGLVDMLSGAGADIVCAKRQ